MTHKTLQEMRETESYPRCIHCGAWIEPDEPRGGAWVDAGTAFTGACLVYCESQDDELTLPPKTRHEPAPAECSNPNHGTFVAAGVLCTCAPAVTIDAARADLAPFGIGPDYLPAIVAAPLWVRRYDEARRAEAIA